MTASAPWRFRFAVSLVALSAIPASGAARPLLSQSNAQLAGAVGRAVPSSRVAVSTPLSLTLALPLRNQPQLDKLLQDLYDPNSPRYGRYLTSADFAAQFGPTTADYQKLIDYAKSQGMTVTGTSPNRMVLSVSAPTSTVESVFHVNEVVYQRTNGTLFRGPDRAPTVGDDCPVNLLCVGGLDDANPLHHLPMNHLLAHGAAARNGVVSHAATGPGGFSPSDLRKAYDVPSTLTGAGVTMGVFQNTGYLPSDITSYEDFYGLRHVPLENDYIDGRNDANQGQSGETTLDIEMQIAIASGADKEIIYIGGPALNILNRIATENRAKVVSCSLGWGDGTDAAEDQAFRQMAAQGQSFFVAAGDGGEWVGGSHPEDDPYITSVGGSRLNTNPDGSWLTEPSWFASGGGYSREWSIPSYQVGLITAANNGSNTFRNAPDVAAVGDPGSGLSFFNNGGWGGVGGTSASAPIWAGIAALVNQQRAANGLGPVGFMNPAIYTIGRGTNYTNDFHDTLFGDNSNGGAIFKNVPGFDLVSGWGTPIVANLAADLSVGTGANFRLKSTPVTVAQGASAASTISVAGYSGFTSSVSLTLGTLPVGVTASLSAASTTGTSTLTVSASNVAIPTAIFVQVTGVSGTLVHVTYVPVTITPVNGAVTVVNLASAFNSECIFTDGTQSSSGGLDGGGYAYSAAQLGSSVKWNGTTYPFGPPDTLDAMNGGVVNLPAGSYANLTVLASSADGPQGGQIFTVTYTDNTQSVYSQDISNWTTPIGNTGETVVAGPFDYRDNNGGTIDPHCTYVYGYTFPLDSTKIVKSVQVPGAPGPNLAILAMALTAKPVLKATLTSLYPSSVQAGANNFSLAVNGTGFVAGSQVKLNGAAITTQFVTATQLIATVPRGSVASPGSLNVTVVNPGGQPSAAVALTITGPANPARCAPSTVQAGQVSYSLSVLGSGFTSATQVFWNGGALTTHFVSSTAVTAIVPAANVAAPTTATITVSPTTPATAPISYSVTAGPTFTAMSPATTNAGHAAFTLTATGTNFQVGAQITWNGVALTTTFVSPTQLTATVPAANVANSGTGSVRVVNPGVTPTAPRTFTVTP